MFIRDFELITIKQELITRGNDVRYKVSTPPDIDPKQLSVVKFDKSFNQRVNYNLEGSQFEVGSQGLPNEAKSVLIFDQFVIF